MGWRVKTYTKDSYAAHDGSIFGRRESGIGRADDARRGARATGFYSLGSHCVVWFLGWLCRRDAMLGTGHRRGLMMMVGVDAAGEKLKSACPHASHNDAGGWGHAPGVLWRVSHTCLCGGARPH